MKFFRYLLLLIALPLALLAAPGPYVSGTVTNSAVLVKASPAGGQIFLWSIHVSNVANTNAGAYIQIFDAATAGAVTPGTTAPTWVYSIPPGGVLDKDMVKALPFYNGIVICVTTTWNGSTATSNATPLTLAYE